LKRRSIEIEHFDRTPAVNRSNASALDGASAATPRTVG
jgi:hypothetical protein